jgi:hypothetical protein
MEKFVGKLRSHPLEVTVYTAPRRWWYKLLQRKPPVHLVQNVAFALEAGVSPHLAQPVLEKLETELLAQGFSSQRPGADPQMGLKPEGDRVHMIRKLQPPTVRKNYDELVRHLLQGRVRVAEVK